MSDKRLRVDITRVRKMVSEEEKGKTFWVDDKLHLADSLTKKGAFKLKFLEIHQLSDK